jgi:hypothetical protein
VDVLEDIFFEDDEDDDEDDDDNDDVWSRSIETSSSKD